jgi:SWI/SNF-related matrix-associated actin-dependent regulator of chromatin subfamily A member 5
VIESAGSAAPSLPPFLVLVPKSVLQNWEREIARFAPSIKTAVLIGDRVERDAIIEHGLRPGLTAKARGWHALLTTYELASIESASLSRIPWSYIVVDEAHRLKNEQSSLATVVRSFTCAHRLLITGTPLQNNLHELWALLNFLLPDVFSSSAAFDSWFERAQGSDDDNAKASMVGQLHRVLRPFMLRRLKVDVAKGLPPKKETMLYVNMTAMQVRKKEGGGRGKERTTGPKF